MNSREGSQVPQPDPLDGRTPLKDAHELTKDLCTGEVDVPLPGCPPVSLASKPPVAGTDPIPEPDQSRLDGELLETENTVPDPTLSETKTFKPLEIVDIVDLDWEAVRDQANPSSIRARVRSAVESMEALLDQADGPGMLFDEFRGSPTDKVIKVSAFQTESPLWIIGDLHGDLLALEAALEAVRQQGLQLLDRPPRLLFLGDLFDDEGFGLEVLIRILELIVEAPDRVCLIAGNHDEALSYDGVRFSSSVTPSDFADFLNANLTHEWIERAGKLAVRLFANAPRAIFFPDGLLAVHGGFPLVDLHPALAQTEDWNDPMCLSDFVWTRAHPKARKKLPNRFSRGSQFGYEDFGVFCSLCEGLGRPVTHMIRGHDHVEERYANFPAYHATPLVTTVALSRRLSREAFGSYERVPTMARYVEGALPSVCRLHIPPEMIRAYYPPRAVDSIDNHPKEEH
ncbi:metallophosphoesterase [Rhizobium sp. XQZ8]|uniref:metallophosphoesterase n=1 Tax=Rhizobium populisoli TaxID=2859785 RepID=UPI001CA47093|nr:metallophosphoesterase [Rhizobium populisoli]MBW6424850.1 metallophosphoesterase [Rhizobium populisoli]